VRSAIGIDGSGGCAALAALTRMRPACCRSRRPTLGFARAACARGGAARSSTSIPPSPDAGPAGLADFPIVSQGFAERAYGTVDRALEQMALQGARLPVVTLGPRGSLALHAGRVLASPAPPVAVVDSTGAGDVFRGAFAWGLLQGLEAAALLRIANGAAALSCVGLGAQGGIPDSSRLRAFLADSRRS
jgi:sugar/nucleoside kinase (ribokinase family)